MKHNGRVRLGLAAIMAMAGLFMVIVWARSTVADSTSLPNPHAPLSSEQRRLRDEYWANKRGLHFGVPPGAYESAMAQIHRQTSAAPTSVPLPTWSYIGPQPMLHNFPNFGGVFTGPPMTTSEGRVAAVAADPNDKNRIYVGAAGGGVWRSTDGGATFIPIFDIQPSLAIGAIVVDKNGAVYVGTGEGAQSFDAYYGRGLFRSTDRGDTWATLGPAGQFSLNSIARIAIDSNTPPHIFVAATTGMSASRADASYTPTNINNDGLWRSTDGGNTWIQLGNTTLTGGRASFNNCSTTSAATDPCSAMDVVLDPNNSKRVFAAILYVDVFGSSDGGNTWTEANFPGIMTGTTNQTQRQSVGITSSGPGLPATVYAAVGGPPSNNSIYLGFFRSTDSGQSWAAGAIPTVVVGSGANATTLDGDGTGTNSFTQAWYDQTIAVFPNDPLKVFFGGVGPYLSTDGAGTWNFIAGNANNTTIQEAHSDQHASAIDPFDSNKLYVGNDGGFYVYDVKNGSWTTYFNNQQNQTISSGQIQGLGPHPTNNNVALFGFQDNGTQLFSGQPGWDTVETGDGGFALFDTLDPNYAYHDFASFNCSTTSVSFNCPSPSRSTDGGKTWNSNAPSNSLTNRIGNDQFGFYPPIASDPNSAHRVMIGGHRIYVSTDGMRTWLVQSDNLTGGCRLDNTDCDLQDIEFVPRTTMAWALSTQSGKRAFALSNTSAANLNSTGTWTDVTANLGFNTDLTQATGITVDPLPGHSKIAYLSISGFTTQTGIGHLFLSTDFGQTWVRDDGNGGPAPLPDVPTLRVLVDNTDSTGNTLLAGTDIGVFRSSDRGQTWTAFNTGVIPAVPIFDLEQNQNGVIFAGSHGRGAFRLSGAPTPTATATPIATPSATATPGAQASASAVSSVTTPGATGVNGGTIQLTNTTVSAENVSGLTITASRSSLFASMTLGGGGQSTTINAPGTTAAFTFKSPVNLPAGGSVSFSLTVSVSAFAAADRRIRLAGIMTIGQDGRVGGDGLSLLGALMMLGLMLSPLPARRRSQLAMAVALGLILAATAVGCGGSSNSPTITSAQSATAASVTNSGGAVTVNGLPASLGTITAL